MSKIPTFEHKARKRFGQNFLHDAGVIGRIVRSISPKSDQHLIEIGPGQGAITRDLLASGASVNVVELDKDLVPILNSQFADMSNFNLHQGDALKFDFASLHDGEHPLRVVGNLPYNISTPLMFHLLTFNNLIEDMHFMLQHEVVLRLAAQPGENNYGRLGIMVQYFCQVDYLFTVGPGSFNPPPKVDSAIVRLQPYKELPYPAKCYKSFEIVVRKAFSMRRKTLRNTLKGLLTEEQIVSIGVDPTLRPERITLAEFVALSDLVPETLAKSVKN